MERRESSKGSGLLLRGTAERRQEDASASGDKDVTSHGRLRTSLIAGRRSLPDVDGVHVEVVPGGVSVEVELEKLVPAADEVGLQQAQQVQTLVAPAVDTQRQTDVRTCPRCYSVQPVVSSPPTWSSV